MKNSAQKPTRRQVAILLRMSSAAHRNRLVGIFNRLGTTEDWNIRMLSDEAELRRILDRRGFAADGIISFMPRESRTRELLLASPLPTVLIGIDDELERRHSPTTAIVCNDNRLVAASAVDYFRSLGRFRSFAFIHDREHRPWSVMRGWYFSRRLVKHGCSCRYFHPSRNPEKGAADLAGFLSALPLPAAILVANDRTAIEVINTAKAAGLKIPEALAILGIDNDELFDEHSRPTLSSVRTDTVGLGYAAADELIRLFDPRKRDTRRPVTKVKPIGIVERGSTKPLSPATAIIERAISFIGDNFRNGIGPDDVAKHLGISRRLLDLRFRLGHELSVLDTINDRRLAEMKRLLRSTDLPARSIALQVGFTDHSYATRFFRKATGITPIQWRLAAARGASSASVPAHRR